MYPSPVIPTKSVPRQIYLYSGLSSFTQQQQQHQHEQQQQKQQQQQQQQQQQYCEG